MGLNKSILIGRLVRDVEMRTVGENTNVANFTLAVDRRFKSRDEEQPKADFIPVTVWRKSAEFAEKYFSKGKQVYVCGAIETYSYEKDGNKVYGFRVNADEIGFADTLKTDDGNQNESNKAGNDDFPMDGFMPQDDFEGDDLPF